MIGKLTCACLAITLALSACVPENGRVPLQPPQQSAAANAAPLPEYTIAPRSRIAALIGSWGAPGFETIIKEDGTLQMYSLTAFENGKRFLLLDGYIGVDKSGRLVQILQRFNTTQKPNGRLKVYETPGIADVSIKIEQGIPVLVTVGRASDEGYGTNKNIRTADHNRGYRTNSKPINGGGIEWFVEAPKQAAPRTAAARSGTSGLGEANHCLRKFHTDNFGYSQYVSECRERIQCDHKTDYIGEYYTQMGGIFGTNKVLGRTFNCRYYDR